MHTDGSNHVGKDIILDALLGKGFSEADLTEFGRYNSQPKFATSQKKLPAYQSNWLVRSYRKGRRQKPY